MRATAVASHLKSRAGPARLPPLPHQPQAERYEYPSGNPLQPALYLGPRQQFAQSADKVRIHGQPHQAHRDVYHGQQQGLLEHRIARRDKLGQEGQVEQGHLRVEEVVKQPFKVRSRQGSPVTLSEEGSRQKADADQQVVTLSEIGNREAPDPSAPLEAKAQTSEMTLESLQAQATLAAQAAVKIAREAGLSEEAVEILFPEE